MNAEYPLSHAYFERAILIDPVLKQPITALISKWKVSDTDDERSVYTGSRRYQLFGNFWFLHFFFANSYCIFGRTWASQKSCGTLKIMSPYICLLSLIYEPFSCAAIEQDCTLGLVIQIFNGLYDAGIDFLIVAHKASCHTLSKAFLKSMKTW